jgi:hypothetical protein
LSGIENITHASRDRNTKIFWSTAGPYHEAHIKRSVAYYAPGLLIRRFHYLLHSIGDLDYEREYRFRLLQQQYKKYFDPKYMVDPVKLERQYFERYTEWLQKRGTPHSIYEYWLEIHRPWLMEHHPWIFKYDEYLKSDEYTKYLKSQGSSDSNGKS